MLSAAGGEGTTLKNNSSVGAEVRIFQELIESNEPDVQGNYACQTATGVNWANVFAAINSNYHFLENGVVRVPDAVAHPGYIGYVNLNPRTAICWNSSYVFFVVCDGRQPGASVGMSCETLGNWAKTTLGATDGVNLDGGGSSTMVVNGAVKNVPSDGSERAVCNGVMMVNVKPKIVSTVFSAGQTVTVSGAANIRLGPGAELRHLFLGERGRAGNGGEPRAQRRVCKRVLLVEVQFQRDDRLDRGEPAGGSHQRAVHYPTAVEPECDGGRDGELLGRGLPAATHWVTSGRRTPVKLSNGGHYSGCTTAALTVSGVDSNDVASYRCVVTNAYGSATSSPAALTLAAGCSTPVLLNGSFEGTSTGGIGTNWTGYQRAHHSCQHGLEHPNRQSAAGRRHAVSADRQHERDEWRRRRAAGRDRVRNWGHLSGLGLDAGELG